MPDSKTNWCAHCLAKDIQRPAQIDWPGIPLCRECAAEGAQRLSGEPPPKPPTAAAPGGLH